MTLDRFGECSLIISTGSLSTCNWERLQRSECSMTHRVPLLLFLKFFVVPKSADKQSKLLSCNRLFQLSGNRQKESKRSSRIEHELHKRMPNPWTIMTNGEEARALFDDRHVLQLYFFHRTHEVWGKMLILESECFQIT